MDGILIEVLGDYGPFSTMGKSIGYQVTIGETGFLVDCGAPLFQQIGGHGLKTVSGIIITHCHDDHKRWFTDLALFNRYAPDISRKLELFTTEKINEELTVSSGPALETTLDNDSCRVIDLAYHDYINFNLLGPKPKYRIVSADTGEGTYSLRVIDERGETVGADRAKIIISRHNAKPRLLFKDPDYNEWIEPELFYPFSSTTFYEKDQHVYHDPSGFTIEAINAPVWHGIPSIGLRFSTGRESVVFSGDTAHDLELWEKLHQEKQPGILNNGQDFEKSAVIHGDINDHIERIWSRERYCEAVKAFEDAVVIHDIATRKSVVHTDYRRLSNTKLQRKRSILTHSPDKITSSWALSDGEKKFLVRGNDFFEVVGNSLFPMNAAVYHKEGGRYYVGYKNPSGTDTIYEKEGILNLGGPWNWEKGTELFKVDFYEDIKGKYFPKRTDNLSRYVERPDGKVELVVFDEQGSHGIIVEDQRDRLTAAVSSGCDADTANTLNKTPSLTRDALFP